MTLAKNEHSEVRSASGIVPEAKRSGIMNAHWNWLAEISR
jgi:hypothetical protein